MKLQHLQALHHIAIGTQSIAVQRDYISKAMQHCIVPRYEKYAPF